MLPIFYLFVFCLKLVNSLMFPIVDENKVYNYNPPEEEIGFFFYHRNNPSRSHEVFVGNLTSLRLAPFDTKLPTKMIIHGWTHGKDTPWVREITEVSSGTGLWNVIVVDWSKLSRVLYVEARVHHYVVSKQVKNFIVFLCTTKIYSSSDIHIIGHSMGAQIASSSAFGIYKETGVKIGRISGLDPAAPLYEFPHIESMDEVLDPSDASFVDVIHTNAGYIGMMTPAGHVDFYPNGGEQQWGCKLWRCSHMRACEFFIASIRKPGLFKAFLHDNWVKYNNRTTDRLEVYPMGIAASPEIPNGIYFLHVEDEYTEYTFSRTSLLHSYGNYYQENFL